MLSGSAQIHSGYVLHKSFNYLAQILEYSSTSLEGPAIII